MALKSILTSALLAAAAFSSTTLAVVRTYDFTVGWVNQNPDGLHERRVMGINGQWPIPTISADVGDQVVVNLKNDLRDRPCSLHFHGLFMNGTTHMDGVAQVTQCPVPANSTFTYAFNVSQPGTYWYHSHVDGQYPDGLRGPLIVRDPQNPYRNMYNEELVVTLSDWYHDEMPGLISSFLSVTNPTGAEPVPNSALMNDTQNLKIPVQPGKTYFMRIVNMAAFAPQYFWIEDHDFQIIELDGVYHKPTIASQIYVSAAQRYGILVTMKNSTASNYAIVGSMDQDLFDTVPEGLNPNVTSYLVYNENVPLPVPKNLTEFTPFDDINMTPTDDLAIFESPAVSLTIDLSMDNLGNGVNYAFFNDITYIRPRVPTLYTALTSGNLATDPTVYGLSTNPIILGHNEVVELVLNNHDPGKHPFHLHGHTFQVLSRSEEEAGDWDAQSLRNGSITFPTSPMRRDTLVVKPNGNFVIRFRSDNPGVWLFHCHIEWHVDSGLILTFIEAPLQLQAQLGGENGIPADHFDACKAQDIPFQGNAAGNTVDLLNTEGMNVSPKPLPDGFTARGIMALVFSCIAGLLGCAVIVWYGLGEMGSQDVVQEEAKIDHFAAETGVVEVSGIEAAAGGHTAASKLTSTATVDETR
ncbi:hypothetical protein LTR66_012835 [Elasticomyces elasticus]|nr:hypothetical protein LTR66_012835 [Elasticomyces elasticus]